jgi:RHS repeat-associated protein
VGFSNGVGRLTTSTHPNGSARHAYDAQGRLTSFTQTTTPINQRGSFSHSVAYGYDAAGHLTSITYPSGRVVAIGHAGGLPSFVSLAPNASTAGEYLISQMQFEPFGAARAWAWHMDNNGTQAHERVFDVSGRMVRYPLATVVRDLSYDAADRISSYSHLDRNTGLQTAGALALNQSFGYDELGRITSVINGTGAQVTQWTYSYDANGNRLSNGFSNNAGAGFQTRSYTVANNSNRLLALDNPARSFGHDAAGNTVADSQLLPAAGGPNPVSWTASYGLDGRVAYMRTTPYTSGNTTLLTTTGYGYNAHGQRVLKQRLSVQSCTSPTVCTYSPQPAAGAIFVYGQQGELLGEYSISTGAALREYIWLQGMPLAVVVNDVNNPAPSTTQTMFIHADQLNTPRVVVNRAGAMRWSWMAEPFGNNAESNNPQGLGPFSFNLRMPGQYFDAESGLNYNWHRDYDAGVGRYTQSDPIGLAGGINTYAYVGGDPVSGIDPLGLAACLVNFPDYPIDTGFGFSSSSLGGHGGVVSYNDQGSTRYYDYGRFAPANQYVVGDKRPESEGNVRRVPVPDLVIDPKTGQPTPASLEALRKALSDRAGHKTRTDLTCDKNADETKVNKYAEDFANNRSRPSYSWQPWASNQCRDFANRAYGAGR